MSMTNITIINSILNLNTPHITVGDYEVNLFASYDSLSWGKCRYVVITKEMIYLVHYKTNLSTFQVILKAESTIKAQKLADDYLMFNHPAIFAHCEDIRSYMTEGIITPQVINYQKIIEEEDQ